MGLAKETVVMPPPSRLCWGRISALLSALGRSHCPCIAIRWGRTSRCCLQHGRLVVRLCGSAEATAAVLGARRAGGSTASPCSEHLVRLSRKSQEREGSCADQSNIEAHWLDWARSQKANPPKPTAAQSISGNEATENDSQEYGEGGIRTHEGVTPTRFRVVRDQPDSATSPHALRRCHSLKADEPGTCSMLHKPTALRYGRLEAQPCAGNHLTWF